MDTELVDTIIGAGLANIIMPRREFMKEHKHLIALLNRYKQHPELKAEADKQTAEMQSYNGGFSKQSGFIRRLMAENRIKHKGQYGKPTDLPKGSTMNKPAKFDYKKIANESQKGTNTSSYGASPFIQKHFGTTEFIPFKRKRGTSPPLETFPTKRKGGPKTPIPPPSITVSEIETAKVPIEPTNLIEGELDLQGKPKKPNTVTPDIVDAIQHIEEKPAEPVTEPVRELTKAEKLVEANRAKVKAKKEEAERVKREKMTDLVNRIISSPKLREKIDKFVKIPYNNGLTPIQVAEKFGDDDSDYPDEIMLNEDDIRGEGFEVGDRFGAKYTKSGWFAVRQRVIEYVEQKKKLDDNYIGKVPLDSIPLVSEKKGYRKFTAKQLEEADYQAQYYTKPSPTNPARSFSNYKEGESMIPALVDTLLHTFNKCTPQAFPQVTEDQAIYLVQNRYKLR